MVGPKIICVLLLTVCFSLATTLDSWRQKWPVGRTATDNFMEALLGDSRRLFANHFLVKADVYLHSGYYPSIFDSVQPQDRLHIETAQTDLHDEHAEEEHSDEKHANEKEDEHAGHDCKEHGCHEGEASFLGEPRDWIERFGRNFFPTEHSHLEKGNEREVLPWLRLSAELDPQKIETYTVGAYWLRVRLGKAAEAEQFLREGLRENPDSPEILFELGRIRNEHYKDTPSARNLWELALNRFQKQVKAGQKPDDFVFEQIVGHLGNLAEQEGNLQQAIEYFEWLKDVSPAKEVLDKRIAELRNKLQK